MSLTIIRSDNLGAISTSLFFHSLYQLGVDSEVYLLEQNECLTPKDIKVYCNSLWDSMLNVESKSDYYSYSRQIIRILKSWADSGFEIVIKGD